MLYCYSFIALFFIFFLILLTQLVIMNDNIKKKKNSVAGPLRRESTIILMNWLINNDYNAHPDQKVRKKLASDSNLTLTRVTDWFHNIRNRKWYKRLKNGVN